MDTMDMDMQVDESSWMPSLPSHAKVMPLETHHHDNNDDESMDASEILRRVVHHQRHPVTKQPTAAASAAPYGNQRDHHPLHDAYAQLLARLQAVREVRGKLQFVAPRRNEKGGGYGARALVHTCSKDVHMLDGDTPPPLPQQPQQLRCSSDSMVISTRVALTTEPLEADVWMQGGGILALHGLETLFFDFFSANELVAVSGVCQSWYSISRRNDFWEPLLFTPVEKYPLRKFMGFLDPLRVPAIQVYIIYKKISNQIQVLDPSNDDTPRSVVNAQRVEDLIGRLRPQAQQNNNDNAPPAVADRQQQRMRGATTSSSSLRSQSVHLVYSAEENRDQDHPQRRRGGQDDDDDDHDGEEADGDHNEGGDNAQQAALLQEELARAFIFNQDDPVTRAQLLAIFAPARERHAPLQPAPEPAPARARPRAPAYARLMGRQQGIDSGSDEEEDDAMMVDPNFLAVFPMLRLPAPAPRPAVVAPRPAARQTPQERAKSVAGRRVNLSDWLARKGRMSREVFKSFARQLLVALTTLELSHFSHNDISMANILVLDSKSQPHTNANANSNQRDNDEPTGDSEECFPLFQLYCSRSRNLRAIPPLATTQAAPAAAAAAAAETVPAPWRPLRARFRHGLGGVFGRAAAPAHQRGHGDDRGVPMHFPPPPFRQPIPQLQVAPVHAAAATTQSACMAMVRAYLTVLRDAFVFGRVATRADRNLPFLSLIFTRSELVKSVTFRSLVEFAEYLMSTQQATPSRLLEHAFFYDTKTKTNTLSLAHLPSRGSLLVVGKSSIRPLTFGSADEYKTQAIAWYAQYYSRYMPAVEQTSGRHQRPQATTLARLTVSSSSPSFSPSTRLGPAFFHDALLEDHLPHQRFLSVFAPETATSKWVKTLTVTQKFTLQKLDLSTVEIPMSILLKELYHLKRLTHLRLPREILRDDNMEQFVAALWCTGLLPTLHVMDDAVRRAMDRMEAAYITQLKIMTSQMEMTPTSKTNKHQLHHTFSAPF